MVPKVNLLDPNCEPSDEELAALMEDVRRTAVRKRDATWAQWEEELARAINEAAARAAAYSGPDSPPPSK